MRNLKQEHDLMTDILIEVVKQNEALDHYRKSGNIRDMIPVREHEQIVRRKINELIEIQYQNQEHKPNHNQAA